MTGRLYTDTEVRVIREHYGRVGPRGVGRMLARSPKSVMHKARRLGVKFTTYHGRTTPAVSVAIIELAYRTGGWKAVQAGLVARNQNPMTRGSIRQVAHILGVRCRYKCECLVCGRAFLSRMPSGTFCSYRCLRGDDNEQRRLARALRRTKFTPAPCGKDAI